MTDSNRRELVIAELAFLGSLQDDLKVRRIYDEAIQIIEEKEPVFQMLSGNPDAHRLVCSECQGGIDKNDNYCRHCGRELIRL